VTTNHHMRKCFEYNIMLIQPTVQAFLDSVVCHPLRERESSLEASQKNLTPLFPSDPKN